MDISEEYFTVGKVKGNLVTIYKNPTSDDIKEIVKTTDKSNRPIQVRFFADWKNKNFYIWDGYIAIHKEIFKLNLLSVPYSADFTFIGVAEVKNNTLEFLSSDSIKEFINMVLLSDTPKKKKIDNWLVKFFKLNWSWSYKYMTKFENFIEDNRKILDKWIETDSDNTIKTGFKF